MAERVGKELQTKLLDELVDGVGLYAGDKLADIIRDFGYSFVDKNLGIWSKGALKVGISLIDTILPTIKGIPYVGDWLGLWGRDGVRDIATAFIDKPAYCRANDANTIECFNFDELATAVYIDGNTLTKDTDYTLSGTADDFTISLKTPLTTGKHDLVVVGKKKAFSGWVKV